MVSGMDSKDIILIIEDDKSQASALRDILNTRGYLTMVAENASLAQPLLSTAAIALIDLRLPDKPGIELLRELKEKNPDAEAIIVTGYGEKLNAIESLNLGAFAYLEKPLDQEKLFFSIEKALERRQMVLEVKRRNQEIKGLTSMMSPVLNESIRLLEEARQKDEKLLRLYRGIGFAFRSLDPFESAKQLLPLIAEVLETNRVVIDFIGPLGQPKDRLEYFSGMNSIQVVPVPGGVRDQILKTGAPLFVPDLAKYPKAHPIVVEAGLKSMAGYPLQVDGVIYAVLLVYSFKEDAFSQYKEIISSFADLCVIPIRQLLLLEETKKAHREWDATVNSIRAGIVLMDKDRKIIRYNKAFVRLVGRTQGELSGKTICELVHGHPDPIPNCPIKVCETGKDASIEIIEPFLGGKKLLLRVAPLMTTEGKLSYVYVIRDISIPGTV